MRSRIWAYVMGAAALAYMGFALWQGWRFVASGEPVAVVLGLAVLLLPPLGVWMVWRELSFAGRVQTMADELAAAGELPPELPRTPGGRVLPEAAAEEFTRCVQQVVERPRDPAAWFSMSLAYEAGRDRPRARAAMRYAVALAEGNAPDSPPVRLLPPSES